MLQIVRSTTIYTLYTSLYITIFTEIKRVKAVNTTVSMWKSRLIADDYTFIVLLADSNLPFIVAWMQLDLSLLISNNGQQLAELSRVVCSRVELRWGYA